MIDMITLAIVSIFLSVVCLIYAIHVSIVYKTFNDGIKEWSKSLDDEMMDAINRSSRSILRDLDKKIDELKNEEDGRNEETR